MKNKFPQLLFLFSIVLLIASCHMGTLKKHDLFKNKASQQLYDQARKLDYAGKLDSAIIYFNKADSAAPNTAVILEERGIEKSHLRQYDEALIDLGRAIDLATDPGTKQVYLYNRGLTYMDMNRMDDACKDLKASGKTGARSLKAFCK